MSKKSITELYDLTGQTAVVTGGAMGIGFGIVKRLHEAGANVVIADLAETEGRKKTEQLGERILFIKTDVSNEDDVKKLIKATVDKFSGLDIFVNNAGIFPSEPALSMDVTLWDKIQAVNLRGVFLCSREAANVMVNKGKGNIINIASIDALHPSQIGLAAYDASKHGVWGFTKNLALELGKRGVRVNAIAPGGVATEGAAKMGEQAIKAGIDTKEMTKRFIAKIPLGRMGEPDEVGTVVLFLASEASTYMTGSMIVVDGGALLA